MKKRMLAMVFATLLACGIAGCGGAEEKEVNETVGSALTEELKALPKDLTVEAAAEKGFYTIANGAVVDGQENWDAFVKASEADETASIIICQGTQKEGVVLDNLQYDAENDAYTVVTDTTRDGYEDEKSILKEAAVYTDLKVFENFTLQEGGTAYTVCVLSDNAELTADDFRTHWINMTADENHIYMLFVI